MVGHIAWRMLVWMRSSAQVVGQLPVRSIDTEKGEWMSVDAPVGAVTAFSLLGKSLQALHIWNVVQFITFLLSDSLRLNQIGCKVTGIFWFIHVCFLRVGLAPVRKCSWRRSCVVLALCLVVHFHADKWNVTTVSGPGFWNHFSLRTPLYSQLFPSLSMRWPESCLLFMILFCFYFSGFKVHT